MKRPHFDSQDAVNRLAAAGYDLAAELSNPAPDYVMRRILTERLNVATLRARNV